MIIFILLLENQKKAYYNIYKEHLSISDAIAFLDDNVSSYSTYYDGDVTDIKRINIKKYKEITSEVLAKNNSNADEFTKEFVKLLKEG